MASTKAEAEPTNEVTHIQNTAPGPPMAMAVAAALDDMNLKQIVGVIAGDDTVMAAVRTVEDTYEVMDEIKKVLAQ